MVEHNRNEHGVPIFRLVALAGTGQGGGLASAEQDKTLRDKDTLLLELQHRVCRMI